MAPPASCAPALSTILVEPGCQAEVTETGDIRISVGAEAPSTVGAQLDPIHLSIFSHRFMSIAGQWLPLSVGECVQGRGGAGGMALGGVWREVECDPGEGGQCGPALGWPTPGTGEYLSPTNSHGVRGQEVGSAQ